MAGLKPRKAGPTIKLAGHEVPGTVKCGLPSKFIRKTFLDAFLLLECRPVVFLPTNELIF